MSYPVNNGMPVGGQNPNPYTPREGEEGTQVTSAYVAQGDAAYPVQQGTPGQTHAALQDATSHIGSQPAEAGYAAPGAPDAMRESGLPAQGYAGQQYAGQQYTGQQHTVQQSTQHVQSEPTVVLPQGAPLDRPLQDGRADGATASLTPEDESYLRYRQEDRSIGEIASDALSNATTLVKQEIDLAKVEATQSAKRAGKGIGLLAGAAVAGLMMLFALTLMLWWVIAVMLGGYDHPSLGWSGLIVTILWAIIAGILAMLGKAELDRIKGLPKTAETVSKIPNAVAGNEEKNR